MNRNDPEVELLPSPAAIVRARSGIDKAELDRLVQEKVAEIMAERDAFAFEPFFRSRQIAYELKRLQTIPEQRKWTVYFDRHGCLICQTRKLIHIGNGMCGNCYPRIFRVLKQIIAEGLTGEPARPGAGTSLAQRLLPPNGPQDGKNLHRCWYRRSNETETLLYARVAKQLGVDVEHVTSVARGQKHSVRVLAALKKEAERLGGKQ